MKDNEAMAKGYKLEREFYNLLMSTTDNQEMNLVLYISFFKAMSARLIGLYGLKTIVEAVMSQDPNSFDSDDTSGVSN